MVNLVALTALDATRRPGYRLFLAAAGALLCILPFLAPPGATTRDSQRLAIETSTSTLLSISCALSGVLGCLAVAEVGDRGLTTELLTAPRSPWALTAARLTGVFVTTLCALAVLGALAAATLVIAGSPWERVVAMGPSLAAALPLFAAHIALGAACGRLLRLEGAVLAVLALPWIAQGVLSLAAHPYAALLAGCVPLPEPGLRPRSLAFDLPTSQRSTLWWVAVNLLQTMAYARLACGSLAWSPSAQNPRIRHVP